MNFKRILFSLALVTFMSFTFGCEKKEEIKGGGKEEKEDVAVEKKVVSKVGTISGRWDLTLDNVDFGQLDLTQSGDELAGTFKEKVSPNIAYSVSGMTKERSTDMTIAVDITISDKDSDTHYSLVGRFQGDSMGGRWYTKKEMGKWEAKKQ